MPNKAGPATALCKSICLPIDAMTAFFEKNNFKMHYDLLTDILPFDTIFVHGNLASNVWWEPSVKIWQQNIQKQEKGRAILAEWRGCGKSKGLNSKAELKIPALARDYVDLLKFLNIPKVNVVAHSTGGLIALLAMAEAPDLFHRAVLLDPVSPSGFELTPELKTGFHHMRQNREFCAMVMGATIYNNPSDPSLFEQIVSDAFNVDSQIWDGVPEALSKINTWDLVKRVQHPVLVLHGEFDNILPLSESEKLAKALPTGRFEKLKEQGHSCNIENPRKFVELTHSFLFQ